MRQIPFHAMVLAAGYGTRLRPLTEEIPKPLVPILGVPLLGLILQKLHEVGATRLAVNAHHRSEEIDSFINSLQFKVHVSREDEILGTAGGIARCRGHLRGAPVIICNGDILGDLPLAELLANDDPGLTLAGTEVSGDRGTVGLDRNDRVVRLRGERFGTEVRSMDYMGVARLGSDCLETLPEQGCLIGDWALPFLRSGGRVGAVVSSTRFEDIGTPQAYLEAHLERLDSGRSMVAASARVPSRIRVVRSFVGEGAEIAGEGLVEECVILAGAVAVAPLRRSIVSPRGIVMTVA